MLADLLLVSVDEEVQTVELKGEAVPMRDITCRDKAELRTDGLHKRDILVRNEPVILGEALPGLERWEQTLGIDRHSIDTSHCLNFPPEGIGTDRDERPHSNVQKRWVLHVQQVRGECRDERQDDANDKNRSVNN